MTPQNTLRSSIAIWAEGAFRGISHQRLLQLLASPKSQGSPLCLGGGEAYGTQSRAAFGAGASSLRMALAGLAAWLFRLRV